MAFWLARWCCSHGLFGNPWSNKSEWWPPEGDNPWNLLFSSRILTTNICEFWVSMEYQQVWSHWQNNYLNEEVWRFSTYFYQSFFQKQCSRYAFNNSQKILLYTKRKFVNRYSRLTKLGNRKRSILYLVDLFRFFFFRFMLFSWYVLFFSCLWWT